jgi:hypothetical protein
LSSLFEPSFHSWQFFLITLWQHNSTSLKPPHRTALRTAPRAIMIGYHDIDGILAFTYKRV